MDGDIIYVNFELNNAPAAADDSLGTNEDTPLIITVAGDILVNDSDVDGHVLSVTAFDGTSTNGGTVVDNGDGTWTYTPALNFNGLDSFGYTVGDGQTPELTDTATVSITVGAVNDAPVAADDSLGTNEDTPLIITVAGDILVNDSDVDGHVLSVTAFDGTSTNGGTVVDNGDGTWTYTPALNFNGLDSFGYTVGDGQTPELTDTATVSITVGAVNDAPVAADDSLGTNEDTPLIITVAGDILVNDSDVDGHVLSVTAFDGTSTNGGTVVDNGDGTWTYTPALNFNGLDSFGYTVGDGQTPELTDTATVSITVGAVNDAPVAADDSLGTNEDTPLIITVAGDILVNDSDVDGHVLSVTAFDGTSTNGGTVVDNGDGTWTYTPALNFNGLDSFGYTVGDGQTPELTDTATVSITVGAVNDAPVAADDSLGTNEDTPLIITVAGDILVNDSDVDGHVLSVTAFDGTSTNGGTVVDNGDGTWTYTPALNFNGLDSFGYTVGDGQTPELTDTATVSITVGAVNDAPVAADDSLGTNEDTPLIITVAGDILVNDSDVDGHVLSVTAFDGTSTNGGTVVDNGDGTWTYTPALNFNGLDSFGYTVGDGQTPELTDTATVSITVGAVNDAPVAADDSLGTNEDTPLIITVAGDILVNDSDVDGHVLSVTAFDGTSTNGGTVVDNGDGTWTYTPALNFNGLDSFGYTVGDGQTPELTDTATVSITVGAVNDAPVAADDSLGTNEDTPLIITVAGDILVNDSDVDGHVLSVTAFDGTSTNGGTVVDNGDGTWTYTPALNFNGLDSFGYTVGDGQTPELTDTATVSITVGAVNDAPVAADDSLGTNEDTPLIITVAGDILVNDSDVDGHVLSVTAFDGTSTNGGTVVDNGDGTWTYTPALNFNGLDSFGYTVGDGQTPELTDTATVSITVGAVNDAPVAADDSLGTNEDTPLIITVAGDILVNDSDVDGHVLSVTAFDGTSTNGGTVVDNGDGTWTYTPALNFNGLDSFGYTVGDGQTPELTDTATVSITVGAVNDAPVAADDSLGTNEDTPLIITVAGDILVNDSDVDGHVLSVTAFDGTSTNGGTVVDNGDGTWTYTPALNFNGLDSFGYTVGDGQTPELTDTATVSITVGAVNDAPVVSDIPNQTIAEDGTFADISLDGYVTDVETADADIVWSYSGNSALTVAIDPSTHVATISAPADWNGAESITFTATDTGDGTSPALSDGDSAVFTANAVNDPPIAADDSVVTDEDTAVSIDVLANDTIAPDTGETLTITLVSQGSNGTVAITGGGTGLSYTPDTDFFGVDSFTYTINDGTPGSDDTAAVTVTVNPINDAPVAADDSGATDEDTAVTINVLANDTDVDSGTLVIDSTSVPANGTVVDNGDGTVTYTPAADFYGTDNFTYTISDGSGGTATATVTVMVGEVNDPPVAVDDSSATNEDTLLTMAAPGVLSNDYDVDAGDTITISTFDAISTGGAAVVVNADGSFSYDPTGSSILQALALGDTTTDSFTYTIEDSLGLLTTATVSIIVTGANDAPVANFSGTPVNGTEPLTVVFSDTSTDVDSGIVFWSWNFGDGSPLDTTQNPTHTYTADGTYTVVMVIHDAEGANATHTITDYITVGDSDPVAGIVYSPTDGTVEPMEVQFGDDSTSFDGIVSWSWDFGDGHTSTDQHPLHTFVNQGTYTVTHTVAESDGDTATTTTTITVDDSVPDVDFSVTPASGPEPLVVSFTNLTTAHDTLSTMVWDFGDGSPTSSVQHPTHTFTEGNYTVTLTVTDGDGSIESNAVVVTATAVVGDTDADGDGWFVSDGDCKDDPSEVILDIYGNTIPASSINPGATEICGDGIDQDCFDGDRDCATMGGCIDLADSPLEVNTTQGTANIMLAIDDSGSMDWEFMTAGDNGVFSVGSTSYYYLYQSSDNIYSIYSVNGRVLGRRSDEEYQRRKWQARWSGYNVLYYNPVITYEPWYGEPNAHTDHPKAHPKQTGSTPYLDLNAVYFNRSGEDIINAHYYVWSASQGKPYLVELDGDFKYYSIVMDGSGTVTSLSQVTGAAVPADIQTGRAYSAERQNFANWYSFYRKRWLTAIGALTKTISNMSNVNLGWRSINGNLVQPVLPVKVAGKTDHTASLIGILKNHHLVVAGTPMRDGLRKIGLYYHMTETSSSLEAALRTSPILTDGSGNCQQNFVIIVTDGYYNSTFSGIGNEDGTKDAPYADTYSNTLADIAMHYYANDLAPTIDDEVPTNFVDKANWQHMVTYSISFGVFGHLIPGDYDLYNIDPALRVYPTWTNPFDSDTDDANKARIDDVWHASVNGRGKYFSAGDPNKLVTSLNDVLSDIMARIGSGSSVSVNGEEIDAGAVVYQSLYATEAWSGDVKAFEIDQNTGEVRRDIPLWSAAEQLYTQDWDTGRVIATYDGADALPFRYDDSTTLRHDLFALLDGDVTIAANSVDYLRGDPSREVRNGGTFRDRYVRLTDDTIRDTKLGDIVHSSPLYQRYVRADLTQYGVLFVGGNDGMLHAFNADTGEELFAYVPRLVFENLKKLTQPNYDHHFFVDLTPTLTNTGTEALLVGGLGKGGKGYYALDVSGPEDILSEAQLADRVKWEYPRNATSQSEIDDMGYSFGRAFVAQSNDPAYPWVVVLGNGYQSSNGHAVLIILNAADGTLIKRIDTGVGSCNGLSTPTLIDINRDQKVDYVYAGDLKGNLWKFDLTATNAHGISGDPGWEMAFYNGATPKPLFQTRDAAGNAQPITIRPLIWKHPDVSKHGYLVFFGTGKYFGLSDYSDTQLQTFYGIWDYGDDEDNGEYLGYFDRVSSDGLSHQPAAVSLLEQTEIYYGQPTGITYDLRVLSDNDITWKVEDDYNTPGQLPDLHSTEANHAGWYFDLPIPKERVVKDIYLRNNKLIFISTIPTSSPCSSGGESILHEIDAATGGRLDEAQFDINGDKLINENDLIAIIIPGYPDPVLVPPTGIRYPTVLYPPTILDAGRGREVKLMSTAAGGIVDLWESAENLGIYYWKHNN